MVVPGLTMWRQLGRRSVDAGSQLDGLMWAGRLLSSNALQGQTLPAARFCCSFSARLGPEPEQPNHWVGIGLRIVLAWLGDRHGQHQSAF
jgi:hypothetical protein